MGFITHPLGDGINTFFGYNYFKFDYKGFKVIAYPQKYVDNGSIACASFEVGTHFGIKHNGRVGKLPKSSFAKYRHLNEENIDWLTASKLEAELLAQADANYFLKTGQKRQQKGKQSREIMELCINLRLDHTMEDVEKIVKWLEAKTGFKATYITIHRDEGHTDLNTGNFVANIHAHVRFCTLDPETGKSLVRKALHPQKLAQLQQICAEMLGMPAGKAGAKTKRLSATEYKKKKQEEEIRDLEEKLNKFKERDERLTKIENADYELLAEELAEVKKLYNWASKYQKESLALKKKVEELQKAQQSYKAPAIDTSNLENYSVNIGDGAKVNNVIFNGTKINVEPGANISNCEFLGTGELNIPKCYLNNCLVEPMPSYDCLAGKSYNAKTLGYDAGYLVVDGVSTKPQQREQELKR